MGKPVKRIRKMPVGKRPSAGPMGDRRTKRNRTRSEQERAALDEQVPAHACGGELPSHCCPFDCWTPEHGERCEHHNCKKENFDHQEVILGTPDDG